MSLKSWLSIFIHWREDIAKQFETLQKKKVKKEPDKQTRQQLKSSLWPLVFVVFFFVVVSDAFCCYWSCALAALSFTRVNVRDPLARLSTDSANWEAPKDKDGTKSTR